MIYTKQLLITKWLVLYFTSLSNSILSQYLPPDILELFKIHLGYIKLPDKYYLKIMLQSNLYLETNLFHELNLYTISINTETKLIENNIIDTIKSISGKWGKNMLSNYYKNRIDPKLRLLSCKDSKLVTIHNSDINSKFNTDTIDKLVIYYHIYDSNYKLYSIISNKLNQKSQKYIYPDGIYNIYLNKNNTTLNMDLIYLTMPNGFIKLF